MHRTFSFHANPDTGRDSNSVLAREPLGAASLDRTRGTPAAAVGLRTRIQRRLRTSAEGLDRDCLPGSRVCYLSRLGSTALDQGYLAVLKPATRRFRDALGCCPVACTRDAQKSAVLLLFSAEWPGPVSRLLLVLLHQ